MAGLRFTGDPATHQPVAPIAQPDVAVALCGTAGHADEVSGPVTCQACQRTAERLDGLPTRARDLTVRVTRDDGTQLDLAAFDASLDGPEPQLLRSIAGVVADAILDIGLDGRYRVAVSLGDGSRTEHLDVP